MELQLQNLKSIQPMRLKIINKYGNARMQFDVVSAKEAEKLRVLHAKPSEKSYLYIESGEKISPPREKKIRADNGRILSNAEVRRMGAMR